MIFWLLLPLALVSGLILLPGSLAGAIVSPLAQKSFQGGRYDFILFSLLALTALLAIWRNFQLQQQKKQ